MRKGGREEESTTPLWRGGNGERNAEANNGKGMIEGQANEDKRK